MTRKNLPAAALLVALSICGWRASAAMLGKFDLGYLDQGAQRLVTGERNLDRDVAGEFPASRSAALDSAQLPELPSVFLFGLGVVIVIRQLRHDRQRGAGA